LPVAAAFTVSFSLATLTHSVLLVRRKTYYFTLHHGRKSPIFGGVEMVGYIGRAISANDIWALDPYIVQGILLLVAPTLFAASINIILRRIIRLVGGER
ncbi:hypothetical protein E4T45_00247, partial [Aureobasidium sp. EXF-8846]